MIDIQKYVVNKNDQPYTPVKVYLNDKHVDTCFIKVNKGEVISESELKQKMFNLITKDYGYPVNGTRVALCKDINLVGEVE